MVQLTARQSTRIFGWINAREVLCWDDVVRCKLTLDGLMLVGLTASELMLVQPDPAKWVEHGGASLKHARFMIPWGANPFIHFKADLADVLTMRLSIDEMIRMGITYQQLLENGMNEITERMFRFDEEEWQMLGRRKPA